MCVKMNEDIAEIIAAENLKRFGKYVLFFLPEHIWMKLKGKHKNKNEKKIKIHQSLCEDCILWIAFKKKNIFFKAQCMHAACVCVSIYVVLIVVLLICGCIYLYIHF